MRDRRSLSDLVAGVRAKRGEQALASTGAQDHPRVVDAINEAYRSVWSAWSWPTLEAEFEIPLDPGVFVYSLPPTISSDGIESVYARFRDMPHWSTHPLLRTRVAPYQLTDDRRLDPSYLGIPRQWGVLDTERFWLRPGPDDRCQSVVIRGRLAFRRLINDADVCLIDPSAVEWLAVTLLADEDVEMRKAAALADEALLRAKCDASGGANISMVSTTGFPATGNPAYTGYPYQILRW